MAIRVAFTGASGTGKSTLAEHIVKRFNIPLNPVGARSIALEMGFASPYDVDVAGKRREFQSRVVDTKTKWEAEHESFVTDRTTLDNFVYTIMHDVNACDRSLLDRVKKGMQRYTHVVYLPVSSFVNIAGDPCRVDNDVYQEIFDAVLEKFLERMAPVMFHRLAASDLEMRKSFLNGFLAPSRQYPSVQSKR